MNGIIYDIKRFAIHDGPGIRTTVFLKGCCCDCWWCHNPESRSSQIISIAKEVKLDGKSIKRTQTIGEEISVDKLLKEILKDQVFYEQSGGGVTFSGGEAMQQKDFLIDILKACKAKGIHTTLDTSACFPEAALDEVKDLVDLFLLDLKFHNNALHQKYIGVDNKAILQNITTLLNSDSNVWIRIPVIPDINTTDIDNMLAFLNEQQAPDQVNLLPYHKIGKHKYEKFGIAYRMEETEEPTAKAMEELKIRFEKQGYKTIIGG